MKMSGTHLLFTSSSMVASSQLSTMQENNFRELTKNDSVKGGCEEV
jgi:hypothetical protein